MTNEADLNAVRHELNLLDWVAEQRKILADVEEKAKAVVQEALGDNEIGTLDGHQVVTWKRSKRNSLSQRLLKQPHPDVYAECVETTEVRTSRRVEQ